MFVHAALNWEFPMVSNQETPTIERGRHRRTRRRASWVAAASVSGLLSIAAIGAVGLASGVRSTATRCPAPRTLRVSAAPEIAPVVALVADSKRGPGCRRVTVTVTPADPAEVAAKLGDLASTPDVWIADSSLWLAQLPRGTGGSSAAHTSAAHTSIAHTSIARSPAVLAVSTRLARHLGPSPSFGQLAAAAATAHPIVLGASPARSAAALAVLVSLRETVDGDPTRRGNLAAMLRAMEPAPDGGQAPGGLPALPASADGLPVALPTTEQAVWTANDAAGTPVFTAVYPPAPGTTLDYPYVVLTDNATGRNDAAALLAQLTGPAARAALEGRGFRTTDGAAGPDLTAAMGVDPGAPAIAGGPSPSDARAVLEALAVLDKPSRVLAAIDVSGSMADPIPGQPGGTRIGLARGAAGQALALFPAGTVAGLWQFSAELTPAADYQELMALTQLTAATRGRLAAAVAGLKAVPGGGTGLYDTVLAAVRTVRAGYDPTRINSVVVLSDGKDEDDGAHGITLPALLAALEAENDPQRPVPVITIAYGPDSDDAAMRTISAVTGGILYPSKDPRDLPQIFRDAIGQRLCRPSC
jgi:Ca-activated chloride channel homolog